LLRPGQCMAKCNLGPFVVWPIRCVMFTSSISRLVTTVHQQQLMCNVVQQRRRSVIKLGGSWSVVSGHLSRTSPFLYSPFPLLLPFSSCELELPSYPLKAALLACLHRFRFRSMNFRTSIVMSRNESTQLRARTALWPINSYWWELSGQSHGEWSWCVGVHPSDQTQL